MAPCISVGCVKGVERPLLRLGGNRLDEFAIGGDEVVWDGIQPLPLLILLTIHIYLELGVKDHREGDWLIAEALQNFGGYFGGFGGVRSQDAVAPYLPILVYGYL
jgi:hypothetical protein